MGDDSPWLVLQVMSGRELSVREALGKENIEVLVPMKMGPKIAGKDGRYRRKTAGHEWLCACTMHDFERVPCWSTELRKCCFDPWWL
ncbi:hypothetical protein HED54_09845 [Ochrobactrum anthropi ATCC 49188]|nr:hypothetical protein [Brucella anthropi ATCC 49188]